MMKEAKGSRLKAKGKRQKVKGKGTKGCTTFL